MSARLHCTAVASSERRLAGSCTARARHHLRTAAQGVLGLGRV